MILGTHTSGQAPDHLMIAEVVLPKSPLEMGGKEVAELYDEERQGEWGAAGRDDLHRSTT
jgi:histone-binding protein RBBP4